MRLLLVGVLFSGLSVLSWYCFSPLSNGPIMFVRSENRGLKDGWNWGFTYRTVTPTSIDSEGSLARVVQEEKRVRVVGGAPSFSPVLRTEGALLSLDYKEIIIAEENVTVRGGATIEDVLKALLERGKVIHGFGGGTHTQTGPGGISTNLHGAQGVLLADSVLELVIMAADGTISATRPGEELCMAALSGLGQVGVIVEVVLKTYDRVCLDVVHTELEFSEGLSELFKGRISEYRTSGYGVGRLPGVLTVYSETEGCGTEYPADTDYMDAYVYDNWISFVFVLTKDVVTDTAFFHRTLVNGFKDSYEDVIGIERGWRGNVAPLFGQVFTEFAVPTESCERAVLEAVRTSRANKIMVSGVTVKPLRGKEGAVLEYAPVESCAVEIYYLPCQEDLKANLIEVEAVFRKYNGRVHLGKVFFGDDFLGGRREDAFEEIRGRVDPGGKFRMEGFKYEVDYDALAVRAVTLQVLVVIAAVTVIAALCARLLRRGTDV